MEVNGIEKATAVYGIGAHDRGKDSAMHKDSAMANGHIRGEGAGRIRSEKSFETLLESKSKEFLDNQEDGKGRDADQKAIEQINSMMKDSQCVLGISELTEKVVVQVIDKNTKEIVMEFPSKQMQEIAAKARELSGIVVDEKR